MELSPFLLHWKQRNRKEQSVRGTEMESGNALLIEKKKKRKTSKSVLVKYDATALTNA